MKETEDQLNSIFNEISSNQYTLFFFKVLVVAGTFLIIYNIGKEVGYHLYKLFG